MIDYTKDSNQFKPHINKLRKTWYVNIILLLAIAAFVMVSPIMLLKDLDIKQGLIENYKSSAMLKNILNIAIVISICQILLAALIKRFLNNYWIKRIESLNIDSLETYAVSRYKITIELITFIIMPIILYAQLIYIGSGGLLNTFYIFPLLWLCASIIFIPRLNALVAFYQKLTNYQFSRENSLTIDKASEFKCEIIFSLHR